MGNASHAIGRGVRRRAALAAIASAGAALAAACGGGAAQTPAPDADRTPVTLSVETQQADALVVVKDKLVDLFRQAYPWVQLQETYTNGVQPTFQRIQTLLAGGTPPDVVYAHPQYVTDLAATGALLPLEPLASKDKDANLADFYPGILDHFRDRGAVYGLPWNSGPSVVFFNKGLIGQAGVKPLDEQEREGKWDWAAFRAAARQSTQRGASPALYGLEPLSMALSSFDAWIWANKGEVFSKDLKKCLLGERPAVEAGQYLYDLYKTDQVVPGADEPSLGGNAFESGRVALRIGIKGQVRRLTDRAGQANIQLGMAPTPKGAGGRANRDGPQAYSLIKESKHRDAGWLYTRFMANLDTQKVRLEAKVTVPVRKSAAKLPEFSRSLEPWENGPWWEEAAATTRALEKPPRYTEADRAWLDTWDRILSGAVSVRAGMEAVARQIDALIAGG